MAQMIQLVRMMDSNLARHLDYYLEYLKVEYLVKQMDAVKLMVVHWAKPTEQRLVLCLVTKMAFHLVKQMAGNLLLVRQMESNLVPHLALC